MVFDHTSNLRHPEVPTMRKQTVTLVLCLLASTIALHAQSAAQIPKPAAFDVATINPVDPAAQSGRYIKMEGDHRFIAYHFPLNLLVAAAYDLNPRTISGGPKWVDSDHFDILAITPGDTRPTREQQMAMLRTLLTDRFGLTFHRESKVFSIYELEVAPGGPKLKPTSSAVNALTNVTNTVYPSKVVLPARNATIQDVVAMMQRAMLDRPVLDKTDLTGRYDFDLEWAPDETQFGGALVPAPSDSPSPPLFTALQQQLGLKLVATKGPVDALIIDHANLPTAN
jgi:uncharacterized protein (TIGR03435 family)